MVNQTLRLILKLLVRYADENVTLLSDKCTDFLYSNAN